MCSWNKDDDSHPEWKPYSKIPNGKDEKFQD